MGRAYASKKSIQRYLRDRLRDLRLIRMDMRCRPFSGDSAAPELVMALDWSEVYAYIGGAGPPSGPLENVIENRHSVEAAHEVALSVLCDRGPVRNLILLPSYAAEMGHYVRAIQHTLLPQESAILERPDLEASLEASSTFHDLLHALSGDSADTNLAQIEPDDLRHRLATEDPRKLTRWVENEFGRFFLMAKLVWLTQLDALQKLIGDRSGATLTSLGQVEPEVAAVLENHDIRPFPSLEHLPYKQRKRDKTVIATKRDIAALAEIAATNVALHEHGKQLLFVTRDEDVIEAIEAQPGRFACLSDHYNRRWSTHGVPTITRTWSYFLELGAIWEGEDYEGTRRRAEEAYHDVLSKLTWIERGRGRGATSEVLKEIRRDFDNAVQNRRALVSTVRPWLPLERPSTTPDIQTLAVKAFISFVTDPAAFSQEREAIRNDLLKRLHDIQKSLTQTYRLGPRGATSGPFASLTGRLVRHIGVVRLSQDVRTPGFKQPLRSLLSSITSDTINDLSRIIPLLEQGHGLTEEGAMRDVARLELTTHFVAGGPEQVAYHLQAHREVHEGAEPLSGNWLCRQIITADHYLGLGAPVNASRGLRNAWVSIKDTMVSRKFGQQVLGLALLNCRLLLNLDWVEQHGEEVDAFPITGASTKPELMLAKNDLEAQLAVTGCRDLRVNHLRSIENNLVYACARLVPLYEPISNLDGEDIEGLRDQLLGDPIKSRVSTLARQSASGQMLDTVAYYHLKCAVVLNDQVGRREHLRKARHYLHRAESARPTGRTAMVVRRHRDLISELDQRRLLEA